MAQCMALPGIYKQSRSERPARRKEPTMNPNRIALGITLLTALIMFFTLFSLSGPSTQPSYNPAVVTPSIINTPVPPVINGDDDHRARDEMHAHAAKHLGVFVEHPGTEGSDPDYFGWYLHWIEVQHGDDVAIVYEATKRTNPEIRFTTLQHRGSEAWAGWDPAVR
jgi:desulfoferrodoxin (superoxide reductase-like protein)